MEWFADPVPFIWGGLALAAFGIVLDFIINRRK